MFSKLGVDIDAYWCDISGLKSVRACVKQLDIFKATHGHFPAVKRTFTAMLVATKLDIFNETLEHFQSWLWRKKIIF